MKWEMEILSSTSNQNWFFEESKNTRWTNEENKLFERALAIHDKETPDRWQRIADMIPGKSVMDVMKQYNKLENDVNYIEAGLFPVPGYSTSSFTLDWVNNHRGFGSFGLGGKRSSSSGPSDQERKKGIPWTEDEHRLFLLGLKKYGKGDWRNISRNYVITRTPTQVASHAQKYFLRQLTGGKDKRRSSIHDITTVNYAETTANRAQPDNNGPCSPDQSALLFSQSNMGISPKAVFDWNQPNGEGMNFSQTNGNLFVPSTYGMSSYSIKHHGQNLHRGAFHGSHIA